MNATALEELDGKLVLVCSARDHRNPPIGRRGTVVVHDRAPGGPRVVEVEIEFPQMFMTRAHQRRIVLTDAQVAQLLGSENYGSFTVTIEDRLDPRASGGDE